MSTMPFKIQRAGALAADLDAVPDSAGVYLFLQPLASDVVDEILGLQSVGGSTLFAGRRVIYVGCSHSNLRARLKSHLRGSSSGSTFRMSLGALLRETLTLSIRGYPGQTYFSFGEGEARLTCWIQDRLEVAYRATPRAASGEAVLIKRLSPPFNISQRHGSASADELLRLRANMAARWLPKPNQPGLHNSAVARFALHM